MLLLNIMIIKNEEQNVSQLLKVSKQEVSKSRQDFNFRQIKAFVKNHFGPHWWAENSANSIPTLGLRGELFGGKCLSEFGSQVQVKNLSEVKCDPFTFLLSLLVPFIGFTQRQATILPAVLRFLMSYTLNPCLLMRVISIKKTCRVKADVHVLHSFKKVNGTTSQACNSHDCH